MLIRFGLEIGSVEENLILLTGLKESLTRNLERILEIFKEMEEHKGKTRQD